MKSQTLEPIDGRKSFYGKAFMIDGDKQTILVSYLTKIATYHKDSGKITLSDMWDYSQTTLRHLRAFLEKFAGDGKLTKKQIAKKYLGKEAQ